MNLQKLNSLTNHTYDQVATIYLNTETDGLNVEKAQIQLKNSIKELEGKGVSEELQAQLTELRGWVDDEPYWQNQDKSLVILVSPEEIHAVQLSEEVQHRVSLGKFYDLQKVIESFRDESEFMILDFSEKHNRVIHCRGKNAKEIEIEDKNWPDSLDDAIALVGGSGETLQMHVEGDSGIFHGHSKFKDKSKQRLFDYMRMMDDVLSSKREFRNLTFVLSSTNANIDMYLNQSNLPNFVNRHVEGNNEHLSEKELCAKSYDVLSLDRHQRILKLINELQDHTDSDLVLEDIASIATMALQARVEKIIVQSGLSQEGAINEKNEQPIADPKGEGLNLVNVAVQKALASGADVYFYDEDSDIKLKNGIIAKLRW